jgi:superoxide reductase
VPEEETGVLTVKIGSVEHPMTREHYIEWVEVQEDKISLLPGSNSQVSQ